LEGLDIDAFLDESARRLFLRDPENLTIGGLADLLGAREDQLTDVSDGYIRETQKLQSDILDLLKEYDSALFTPSQALNAATYEWYLDEVRFPLYTTLPVTHSTADRFTIPVTGTCSGQRNAGIMARLGQVK
jgi:hypothetical protein